MAITQIGNTESGTTKSGASTLTSLTINRPTGTGVQAGDILIAAVTANNVAPTAPSDWTNFDGLASSGNPWQVQLYWKLATGSEPSSYTWTVSNDSGAGAGGFIQAWRGVDPVNPIDGTTDTLVDTAIAADAGNGAPSVTVASSAGRLLFVRGIRRSSNGGSTGTMATSTSGWGVHATVNALSGSGGTLYALGAYSSDTEYTTSGTKSGPTTSFSLNHHNLYRATFGLKAANPASGSITSTLGKVSSTFTGERELPEGPVNAQLPKVGAAFTASGAPPEGVADIFLPKLSSAWAGGGAGGPVTMTLPSIAPAEFNGAVNPIGGFAGQLPSLSSSFLAETAVFGEHVIRVEPEDRAFRVVDDGSDVGLKPIKRSKVTTQ
jgi:hypothetical protein